MNIHEYQAKEILSKYGVSIPKEINHKSLSENYNIPASLNDLAEKGEKGYLALKIANAAYQSLKQKKTIKLK